jgi:PE-PPE domain
LGPPPTVSPAAKLSADSTALLVCGFTCPTWHEPDVEIIMNQYVTPTHPPQPGDTITPVAVTTPSEVWPVTGLVRLLGLAFGPSELFGPGGAAWPDEPWWKLSGLFDLTSEQSQQAGVADLEAAMAKYGNDHLVIYGESAGENLVNREKRKLAEQYAGTPAPDIPDISFVLQGDANVPNGGLLARFPGLYIPILDFSFDGPEPTDTPFHTDVIIRQYDGASDFPLYPINVIADLNAVLGVLYVHFYPFDVSLAPDPSTSPPIQSQYGDTTYHFFKTQDLPLFAPLRTLGVPEPVIDVVEPVARWAVELGYDRSIPLGEPTPARLIPRHDPATVVGDLLDAIGEGLNNAAALTGSPPPKNAPQNATVNPVEGLRAAVTDAGKRLADVVGGNLPSPSTPFGAGISPSLRGLNLLRPDQGDTQAGTDRENPGPQPPLGGSTTKITHKSLTDGFKFTPPKPNSAKGNTRTGGPSTKIGAKIHDSLQQVAENVDKAVHQATDSLGKGLSGFNAHKVDSKG